MSTVFVGICLVIGARVGAVVDVDGIGIDVVEVEINAADDVIVDVDDCRVVEVLVVIGLEVPGIVLDAAVLIEDVLEIGLIVVLALVMILICLACGEGSILGMTNGL